MTAPTGGPVTRWWRSRAFWQPLLITIGGVIATVAAVRVLGPSDVSGNNVVGALVAMLGLVVGLLVTGFVVGLSSPDTRLALLASLLAACAMTLARLIADSIADAASDLLSFGELLTVMAVLTITPLVPIWLGFGVGRLVRPSPKDRSDTMGPD